MNHSHSAAANVVPSSLKAWPALSMRPRRSRPRKYTRATSIVSDAGRKPLVIVGSVNADMMLQVDRFPKPGETLSAKSMNTSAGGKVLVADLHHTSRYECDTQYCTGSLKYITGWPLQGANQAAAAASLGYPTYFLGQVRTVSSAMGMQHCRSCCLTFIPGRLARTPMRSC